MLPVAVFVASYLAQSHIGYAALALPLLAFGVRWLLVGTAAASRRVPPGRARALACEPRCSPGSASRS